MKAVEMTVFFYFFMAGFSKGVCQAVNVSAMNGVIFVLAVCSVSAIMCINFSAMKGAIFAPAVCCASAIKIDYFDQVACVT